MDKDKVVDLDTIRPTGSLRWEEFKLLVGEGKTHFFVVAPRYGQCDEFIATGNFREDGEGWYEYIQHFTSFEGKTLTRKDYSSACDHNMSRTNGYNDRFIFAYKRDAEAYLRNYEYTTALARGGRPRHGKHADPAPKPPASFDPFHYEPKRVIIL